MSLFNREVGNGEKCSKKAVSVYPGGHFTYLPITLRRCFGDMLGRKFARAGLRKAGNYGML